MRLSLCGCLSLCRCLSVVARSVCPYRIKAVVLSYMPLFICRCAVRCLFRLSVFSFIGCLCLRCPFGCFPMVGMAFPLLCFPVRFSALIQIPFYYVYVQCLCGFADVTIINHARFCRCAVGLHFSIIKALRLFIM